MQIFPNTTGVGTPGLQSPQAQDTSSSSGTDSSSAGTATVTANDFLQLLVAEMKNQDPTSNTDPNEYINQLVQVNSLEQLVQINGDLGGGGTTSSTGTGDFSTANSGQPTAGVTPAASGSLSAATPGSATTAALRVASALGTTKDAVTPSGAASGATNPYDAIAAAIRGAHAASTTTTSPAR